LDRNVVKFRNVHIEHVAGPEAGLRWSMAFTADRRAGDPALYLAGSPVVYVGEKAEQPSQRPPEPGFWEPDQVIERIERYLAAAVLFFAFNADVSVIAQRNTARTPQQPWQRRKQ